MIETILKKAVSGKVLTREDARMLLAIPNGSHAFYQLLDTANAMSRRQYHNKAYIFSQIGLNATPCPMNCKFCSMAESNYVMNGEFQKTMADIGELKETARQLVEAGTHDLFLMTTANYPVPEFLRIGEAIRSILSDSVRLVSNIGDMDLETARTLKQAGFTGAYHICRLGEGKDTDIAPEQRIATLNAIRDAGLELYYCVEPIGPEHAYDELIDEMERARSYQVEAMAVMRRIPVPGTPLAAKGMISAMELTKIAAVTRLFTQPGRSMNAHEVTPMTLLAGVNQLYAEVGANPRDDISDTADNRGWGVRQAAALLKDAEYEMA